MIAFGVYEYSAKSGFNRAVTALDTRIEDEDKGLATVPEAEQLLGKEPDGPAVEFTEGAWNFNKKTYTWKGLLKNYTLTAYYTKEQDSRLHHFLTEGAQSRAKARTEDQPCRAQGSRWAEVERPGRRDCQERGW